MNQHHNAGWIPRQTNFFTMCLNPEQKLREIEHRNLLPCDEEVSLQ